jgi:hypothetical protein
MQPIADIAVIGKRTPTTETRGHGEKQKNLPQISTDESENKLAAN